ncbi:MAG: hypothetical protein J4F37_07495 [Acidobacteria bacterium]|nr:hypothetical protein [Acidobacteriota bacterium]
MRVDGIRSAAAAVGALLAAAGLAAPATGQEWTAQEIVERAVARADGQRDAQEHIRYHSRFESITEKLSGDGEVEEAERETYEQYPLEGVLYEELVAREGEPLDADDAREERERRREFVEEVRERRARGVDPRPEDENRVELNDDFISRYQYSIVGEEVREGYDCWIIQLVPRPGDLPVNRRIDTALNKSTGRLWIVKEDFGLSRVEFEMDEPVRFWGGIAGVLRNTVGRLQFIRTDEGTWVPKRIDIRLDLRIVFWNLRRRIVREWDEYALIPETDQ